MKTKKNNNVRLFSLITVQPTVIFIFGASTNWFIEKSKENLPLIYFNFIINAGRGTNNDNCVSLKSLPYQ
jgi:hypothetical protein